MNWIENWIKVWVSGKMQSRFQQKMCLVYHAQNWFFLSTFKTGNLNLLFYCHNCFLWILSQNRCSYFMKNCPSHLAEVYLEGFQWRYTGLGTQLCIQLMKNSWEKFLLIQILRDKIFIAIISKHFKKLNFVICLFFKQSK